MEIKVIYWIAGLLEGEGYFGLTNHSPLIALKMNDLDTIEKFKNLIKSTDNIFCEKRNHLLNCSDAYVTKLYGDYAASWMMTIYPLMSLRRKSKIREILYFWKRKHLNKSKVLAETRLIKQIMKAGYSKEEAEKKLLESMI